MFVCPTSSPKMTRMFGFAASCASAPPIRSAIVNPTTAAAQFRAEIAMCNAPPPLGPSISRTGTQTRLRITGVLSNPCLRLPKVSRYRSESAKKAGPRTPPNYRHIPAPCRAPSSEIRSDLTCAFQRIVCALVGAVVALAAVVGSANFADAGLFKKKPPPVDLCRRRPLEPAAAQGREPDRKQWQRTPVSYGAVSPPARSSSTRRIATCTC